MLEINTCGTVYIGGKAVGTNELSLPNDPFWILTQPRAIPDSARAPAKRGPKRTKIEWAVIGLETPEQRKTRQAQERADKVAKILKRAPYSDAGRNDPSQADRTNQITGRRIGARHQ